LLPSGKVLVAAGLSGPGSLPDASAELYDPASGTWTATGSLNTARYIHTATLLPNGKVLVAGGQNGDLASAELYDPASGTWTATGSLNTARYDHTATLLPNGKVLVAGGANSTDTLASAELYDPTSGTWTATGSLNTAREFHTASLLPNGNVLVAGGLDIFGGALASAELYGPPLRPAFFTGEIGLGGDWYYLQFPNGTPFGYYSYLTDQRFIYHFDMGYEYWFDANDGQGGIFFYDFASGHFFYTSRSFAFPYLYDFSLNTVLYYYPDPHNPGHYTTNPRYFYNFATGQIITM
jgi:hypothetical protein